MFHITDSDGSEVRPGDIVTAVRHGAKATFLSITDAGFVSVDEPGTSIRCSYPASEYGLMIRKE